MGGDSTELASRSRFEYEGSIMYVTLSFFGIPHPVPGMVNPGPPFSGQSTLPSVAGVKLAPSSQPSLSTVTTVSTPMLPQQQAPPPQQQQVQPPGQPQPNQQQPVPPQQQQPIANQQTPPSSQPGMVRPVHMLHHLPTILHINIQLLCLQSSCLSLHLTLSLSLIFF